MTDTRSNEQQVDDALAEVYDNHRSELYEMIYEYADEEGLDDGFLAHLLMDLAVSTRLNAYASENEEPTAKGIRADLDIFKTEMTALVDEAKKEADAFIEALKEEQTADTDD